MIRVTRGYDSLVPIFPNPSPNEILSLVNYWFPKSTKVLNQHPNDYGSINLSQRIKSIIGIIS